MSLVTSQISISLDGSSPSWYHSLRAHPYATIVFEAAAARSWPAS